MMDDLIHLETCPFCGKQIEKYKLEAKKGFVLELVYHCENCEAEFTTYRLAEDAPPSAAGTGGLTMDDLISRQAAIDALGEKPLAWTESEYEQGLQNQWEQDVDALMALPAAQRLIPVTERLPDEFVSVQAHMTDAGPFPSTREAYRAGGEWFFPALNEYHPVDQWAEFFEPPKEEP